MDQLFRILTFSPRLTLGLFFLITGGIGGAVSGAGSDDDRKPKNAWSKGDTAYSAQQRADDGWGKGSGGRGGVTYTEVWTDKDGVIHEKEDLKALGYDTE